MNVSEAKPAGISGGLEGESARVRLDSTIIILQEPRGVNLLVPPDDKLKRVDYSAWWTARRRYLLAQARAMGAL